MSLTSSDIAALSIRQPRLWWPNGYGDPNLHAVTVGVKVGRLLSDERTLNIGLRRIEYARDTKTGAITTTDIKLFHGDTLYVTEDAAKPRKIKHDEAFTSDAMVLVFTAKDSTGKNKEGKPYRIENHIDLLGRSNSSSEDGFLFCGRLGACLGGSVDNTSAVYSWTLEQQWFF